MKEDIVIIMTTYSPPGEIGIERLDCGVKAIKSWQENLKYEGHLRLHIADDGSPKTILDELQNAWRLNQPSTITQQTNCGVGASLNAAIMSHLETKKLFAYFVDDWVLTTPLDLTPWAELLMADESIGMIRLGPPHPWLTGTIMNFPQGWAMVLDKHHFSFGFRPALYHKRFFDAYGLFPEYESSLECERLYNENYARVRGPDIIYALNYPWQHIGGEGGKELSAVVPGGLQ